MGIGIDSPLTLEMKRLAKERARSALRELRPQWEAEKKSETSVENDVDVKK